MSLVFTASAATEPISISNFTPVDTTLVIDDIRVVDGTTNWIATAWTDDASSGINGALPYTHAYNLGAATGTTINGVNFTGVAGANPAAAGSFSTTGWTSPLADAANNINSGGSAVLADDFVYGGASQTAQTLTLEGLTASQPYRLTIFGVGWADANVPFRSATFGDGGSDILTINEQQFGADNGITIEYDYVAGGSTQVFTLNPTSNATTFHIYGFANAVVPEPGLPVLLVLTLGAIGFRRRRV
jgi:hypothetical protein